MAAAFSFEPFSIKQLKLISWWMPGSPYQDYDMVIADGSIRSGKTIAMIDGFLNWSISSFQGQNFIIAGKSISALKRNVIDPLIQILTTKGIPYTYHRAESYLEIADNKYYIFGANNEASQDVLQGLTAAGALLDEVALFPKSFIDQSIGRCSVKGAKTWWNCNPESPFHYVKTEFIDKAHDKKILHLSFSLDDNLSLAPEVKERYKRMFSGVFYRRNILGEWCLADGVIYQCFDPKTMVTDKLPQMRGYNVAIDAGTQNATVYLLLGYGVDNRLYVIDEYYHSGKETSHQKSPSQYSKDYKDWLTKNNVKPSIVYYDPSAIAFAQQLMTDGVLGLQKANNDVLGGIGLVSSLITSDLLRVHPRCQNLLKEFGLYSWDPKAQQRGEDAPLKVNDHAMDCLRYCVYSNKTLWLPRISKGAA